MANNFGRVNVSISASTGALTAGLSDASKQLNNFRNATTTTGSSMSALNAAAGESAGMFSDIPGLFGSFAASLLGVSRGASTAAIGIRLLSVAVKTLLVPLGVVAAVTAPFRWMADAARAAEELHNLSQETGIAVSDLQTMTQVANELGVSQQQMTGALRRTGRMVGELAQGTPSAVKAFASLGLTMNDLAGLSTAEQFALISEKIASLPPAMQAAAAVDIFGKSGQSMLNFIRGAGEATAEMKRLQQQLGVTLTDEQTAAIEAMGDALGRLSMPLRGFINQFLAELAPAITAVSTLIVDFFANNQSGWSMARTLAQAFIGAIRFVVGAVTALYGVFQLAYAAFAKFAEGWLNFSGQVASSLGFTDAASEMFADADEWGASASEGFANGLENITNPLGAFDAAFAQAQADAQEAGARKSAAAAGDTMAAAISASTKELNAVVVGSSEGEALRNSIMRGADPRLEESKKDAKRTADAAERTADGIEDLAANMQGGGFGEAQIAMA